MPQHPVGPFPASFAGQVVGGARHGLAPQLIAMARAGGASGYIGDGTSRWPLYA